MPVWRGYSSPASGRATRRKPRLCWMRSASSGLTVRRVDFLVLFSKFLQFRWPDRLRRWDIGDNLNPSKDVMDGLFKEGEKCVRSVFTPEMCDRLRHFSRYVTLGASSYYFRDSYFDPHVELVFALDLENGRMWQTGKSYPNPRQVHGLVRVARSGEPLCGDRR